jgi:Saccharopine dehydrogenase NADP binding domain
MGNLRVLVVGGYGFFGSRLVERLAERQGLTLIVAGRQAKLSQALVQKLAPTAQAELQTAVLDVTAAGFEQALQQLRPNILVHTSGPFQGQSYAVARACIRQQVNYIDLADGRAFVSGINALDDDARHAGVFVLSGASSVPALSSAVVDHLAAGFANLASIDIGISPGNRTERGLSTLQAVLSYCGKPIFSDSAKQVIGWGPTYMHRYSTPVGVRLLSPCDVPDLALLAPRYAGRPAVQFGAGLDLPALHLAMNVMAVMARVGLVQNWARHAVGLKRLADLFKNFGSNAGAMHVRVTGLGLDRQQRSRTWELLATEGHGPYVPVLAAAAMVYQRLSGVCVQPGARPCMGVLTWADFSRAAEGLSITTKVTEQ